MAPPSATLPIHLYEHDEPATATLEPGLTKVKAHTQSNAAIGVVPTMPKFDSPYKEREYQKGRLALAFRIFAKLGFDEGVAGHITLRVCNSVL